MKYTTVKLSEIANHPTMRMDAQYWIRKKNVQGNTKRKVQREKNRSKHSKYGNVSSTIYRIYSE